MLPREINHSAYQGQKRLRFVPKKPKHPLPSLCEINRTVAKASAASRHEICSSDRTGGSRVASYEVVI